MGKDNRDMDNAIKEARAAEKEAYDHMGDEELQAISTKGVKIRTDYHKATLVDFIENTIDIAMAVLKDSGVNDSTENRWYYYVGFFNCCRKEEFAELVGQDAKQMLLKLHKSPHVQKALESYTSEQYEQATLDAARRKKEDILKFWDEYVESKKLFDIRMFNSKSK